MPTPHKHAEVIKKWADGATIQARYAGTSGPWNDAVHPGWYDSVEYRVKPTPKEYKYRMALSDYGQGTVLSMCIWPENERAWEESRAFIKWIGPWQTHMAEE